MLVRYWQPWREMELLRRQMDQVFDELTPFANEATRWQPAVELRDAGDTLVLRAELPGIDAKDLDIQVSKESIAITGEHRQETKTEEKGVFKSEFRYGTFHRVISLPVAVQNTEVKADYKDGILNLTLPKAQEALNKVVKVNLSGTTTPTLEQAAEVASNN
jgi:HSP20 family protein